MFAPPRANRVIPFAILIALAFVTILYYRAPIGDSIASQTGRFGIGRRGAAANATLGFGGLYVVSAPQSSRRAHLEQQAAITELNLTIPEQRVWSDDDIRNFRPQNENESHVRTGSVKAWLSHRLVLQEFLDSGLETALVIEDDVDWDIRLRTQQIPTLQKAVQSLSHHVGKDLDTRRYPYGLPDDWDLLYLGHCGDWWNDINEGVGVGHHHPDQLMEIPHKVYEDPSLSWFTDLHPFTASMLTAFRIPEKHRVLHRSVFPLCSFGYAVTRQSAEKILTHVAPSKEDPSKNMQAFDVALLFGCRDGSIDCYTILPELFHHMKGESMIAVEEEGERRIFTPPVDAAGEEQVFYRRETSNIGCGFWSGEFYYDDDPEKLQYLRDEVGRKGRCLKPGREGAY